MHAITQARLDGVLDVSASVPQVELLRGSTLILGSLVLSPGQRARLRWLSAKLLKVLTTDYPTKINSGMGLIYAGLYAGGFNSAELTSGTPLAAVSLNDPTYKQLNPYHLRDLTSPDVYEIVVVNNTVNSDFEVTVTSVLRHYIDG